MGPYVQYVKVSGDRDRRTRIEGKGTMFNCTHLFGFVDLNCDRLLSQLGTVHLLLCPTCVLLLIEFDEAEPAEPHSLGTGSELKCRSVNRTERPKEVEEATGGESCGELLYDTGTSLGFGIMDAIGSDEQVEVTVLLGEIMLLQDCVGSFGCAAIRDDGETCERDREKTGEEEKDIYH
jgi:hypothetical protein